MSEKEPKAPTLSDLAISLQTLTYFYYHCNDWDEMFEKALIKVRCMLREQIEEQMQDE